YRWMAVHFFKQNIGSDTGMAAIAIWKRMNLYHAMMKARGSFQRRENLVLCPIRCIAKQCAKLPRNLKRIDADIFLGQPILACPCPDIAEKPFVQFPDKAIIKD